VASDLASSVYHAKQKDRHLAAISPYIVARLISLGSSRLNSMAAPHVERLTVSEPFLRLASILAEGPFYRSEDDTLHFVDIKAKLLHCVPLSGSAKPRALEIDDMLGVACLIENDDQNYIVAAKRGFGLVNQTTGQLTYIAKVFDNEDDELRFPIRLNKL
jgi:sugar lactone lactonase YvrE